MPLKTPNITPAQVIAGIPVLAALLAAFGVYTVSPEQQDALTNAVQWAFVLVGADAAIRIGRSVHSARHARPQIDAPAIDSEVKADLEPQPDRPQAA